MAEDSVAVRLQRWLTGVWYGGSRSGWLLWPLSLLFGFGAAARRGLYRTGVFRSRSVSVPVVVVGNISVGGTGKTPLVVWLVERLIAHGFQPGVVSRGYGGANVEWPQRVEPGSDPAWLGDEPVMLAQRLAVPVAVGPDRFAACRMLLTGDVDVVVSDDGLQHYALNRDVEIAVVDGARGLGNGRLLPSGPLREPLRRLRTVDQVIVNGVGAALPLPTAMRMRAPLGPARALHGDTTRPLSSFSGCRLHAVAGIGNPQRFFDQLRSAGLAFEAHALADHAAIRPSDVLYQGADAVLMTEKDAVKCRNINTGNLWYIPQSVSFTRQDEQLLMDIVLSGIRRRQKRTRNGTAGPFKA